MPGFRVPRARTFVRSSDAGSPAAKPFSPHLGNSRLANSTPSERFFIPRHRAQSGNPLRHNAYCRRYSSSEARYVDRCDTPAWVCQALPVDAKLRLRRRLAPV